jgi:hypothetical protein
LVVASTFASQPACQPLFEAGPGGDGEIIRGGGGGDCFCYVCGAADFGFKISNIIIIYQTEKNQASKTKPSQYYEQETEFFAKYLISGKFF